MMPREFSSKQKEVLCWWRSGGEAENLDGIICDGAVRSGKTLCLGMSFFLWSMTRFGGRQFAVCGKTVESVRRNMLVSLMPMLEELGFSFEEKLSKNYIEVTLGKRRNRYYLFGGKDESSASLIQGMTLAGVLLDEVALMPRSFVEQALARCSVTGAKFWFSCNPEGPGHWFYKEWILKEKERRVRHLRFFMEDNPTLSVETRERYERAFHGAFYKRFVLGEWTAAEGLVYDFFDDSLVKKVPEGEASEWIVSCDYGTVNPTSMGLWGNFAGTWYRVKEFYYDARAETRQKTDGEYVGDLLRLVGEKNLSYVVLDPSAASFATALRKEGILVKKAKNEVLAGIRRTAQALKEGEVVICETCTASLEEFGSYCWDLKEGAKDQVKKEFDHAMDEIRYFVATVVARDGTPRFSALAVERKI